MFDTKKLFGWGSEIPFQVLCKTIYSQFAKELQKNHLPGEYIYR